MLPMLGALLGPSLLGAGGLGIISSPLLAGAVGSGIGALLGGGDLKDALGAGLGSYLGGSLMGGAGGKVTPAGGNNISAGTPEAATPGLFGSGGSGIIGMLNQGYGTMGMGGVMGAALGPTLLGGQQGEDWNDKRAPRRVSREPFNREVSFPDASYRPGKDPEHRYFQPIYRPTGYAETIRMADGGIARAGKGGARSVPQYNPNALRAPLPTTMPTAVPADAPSSSGWYMKAPDVPATTGVNPVAAGGFGITGIPPMAQQKIPPQVLERMMARRARTRMPTRPMAAGGVVDMAPMPPMQPQQNPSAQLVQMVKQLSDMEIVRGATMAIKGMMKDKEAAVVLAEFIERNGQDKFEKLLKDVQQGKAEEFPRDAEGVINGAGGPKDDMVPAMVMPEEAPMPAGAMGGNAMGHALLSPGEMVIPEEDVRKNGGPAGVKQALA